MKKTIIITIIVVASLLRLIDLGGNRPHLTNDEAAFGYNAYSILQTQRDEHGTFMPLLFKSFGDWKSGLYVYATVPSVGLLGLNEFATRLPSAIAGIIAVYLIYLLSKILFKNLSGQSNEKVAVFSAFFLAISPWHITFSRGAWEANLALTLTLSGVYFFLRFLNSNNRLFLFTSALSFGLTLWSYHSAKLISLSLILLLAFIYRQKLLKVESNKILTAGLILFFISIPIIFAMFSGKAGRLSVISVFSTPRSDTHIQETILNQGDQMSGLAYSLFHSEKLYFVKEVVYRYFNHFSGRYLFFEGDWVSARHTSPNIGYLLILDFPILILGLVYLARNIKRKNYQLLLFWLIISPLPAALSKDSVHGIRSLNMVVPLSIILGLGVYFIYLQIKNRSIIKLFSIIYIALYLFNFVFFLDAYFVHAPVRDSQDYLYGYKQIANEIIPIQDDYNQIVLNENFDQAYIYFLFYGASQGIEEYQPRNYQLTDNYVESEKGDVGKIAKLGNINFRPINWSADRYSDDLILVGREVHFPEEVKSDSDLDITQIRNLDGSPGFLIVKIE